MINLEMIGNEILKGFQTVFNLFNSFVEELELDSDEEKTEWAKGAMAIYYASKNIVKCNYNYLNAEEISEIEGIMIHSTGNPGMDGKSFIKKYYSCYYPDNDDNKCAHAVVDLDGSIYQILPWKYEASHCDGEYENYIAVVLCEPEDAGSAEAVKAFKNIYEKAVELCALLCQSNNLDPDGKNISGGYNVLLGHNEILWIHKDSDKPRNDPEDYWSQIGGNYSMDTFRNAVKKKIEENKAGNVDVAVKLLNLSGEI